MRTFIIITDIVIWIFNEIYLMWIASTEIDNTILMQT